MASTSGSVRLPTWQSCRALRLIGETWSSGRRGPGRRLRLLAPTGTMPRRARRRADRWKNHDLGGCGFDGGFTAEVLDGAGEFAVTWWYPCRRAGRGATFLPVAEATRRKERKCWRSRSRQARAPEGADASAPEEAAGDLFCHICRAY